MKIGTFRILVSTNARWFQGRRREKSAALANAESVLGVKFPDSLKWLLRDWGYSAASGIPSLASAVEATLRCRSALGLPRRYVVLEDRNDAGVVILDTAAHPDPESCPVYRVGTHNLGRLAANQRMDADCDWFAGFGEWVESELNRVKAETLGHGPGISPRD